MENIWYRFYDEKNEWIDFRRKTERVKQIYHAKFRRERAERNIWARTKQAELEYKRRTKRWVR